MDEKTDLTTKTEEILANRQYLLDEARQLLAQMPSAQQVVLLQAAAADAPKLYHYYCMDIYQYPQEEEDACILAMLEDGNTQVLNIVCMDNVDAPPPCIPLELPRWTIRKKIRNLDPRNDDACVLGWGDYKTPNGVGGKTLYVVDTPYQGGN